MSGSCDPNLHAGTRVEAVAVVRPVVVVSDRFEPRAQYSPPEIGQPGHDIFFACCEHHLYHAIANVRMRCEREGLDVKNILVRLDP